MLSLCIIFIGVILLHPNFSAWLDCKTVGFFLKISKEIGRAWRKSLTRAKRASLTRPARLSQTQSRCPFSASFQAFCLTARAYLNTQNTDCFGCEDKNGGHFTRSKSKN